MLTWGEWQEKAESSLEAACILLDNGKPVEAVNRAYYAAYQTVTGVLIKIGQTPRADWGNWSHDETQILFATRICHRRQLSRKERWTLTQQVPAFKRLLRMRYQADYGQSSLIDAAVAAPLVREAGHLISLSRRFIRGGLL